MTLDSFLQNRVVTLSSYQDIDQSIRRAFATLRLCYDEVADGVDQVKNRCAEVYGKNWLEEYFSRNNEYPRMDPTNKKATKS